MMKKSLVIAIMCMISLLVIVPSSAAEFGGVSDDFDDTRQPFGNAYDMGAYEFFPKLDSCIHLADSCNGDV